jgi:hypothetical protein
MSKRRHVHGVVILPVAFWNNFGRRRAKLTRSERHGPRGSLLVTSSTGRVRRTANLFVKFGEEGSAFGCAP